MYVQDFDNPLEQAKELERVAQEIKGSYYLKEARKKLISIGTHIYDLDSDKVAVVEGLNNGCIDFSADYVDGSYSRGYLYTVGNWRIATKEEIEESITQ